MKLNKTTIVATMAVATGLVFAEEAPVKFRKNMTPEQRQAWHRGIQLRRTGGTIREAGSAKGTFVILNAQKNVPAADIRPILVHMDEAMAIQVALKDVESVSVTDVAEKIKAAGGTVGVAIVDEVSLPTLLTAPETQWSIVNVAKLAEKCPDVATLAARVRKEILRSLAFTTGGAYTTIGDPLMRDVTKPGDLDGLLSEEFGLEIMNRFKVSAVQYGLKPWHVSTYKVACQEGWAPAPTNDVQKAIWDKVHALPQNPMKIEFDAKKGR